MYQLLRAAIDVSIVESSNRCINCCMLQTAKEGRVCTYPSVRTACSTQARIPPATPTGR